MGGRLVYDPIPDTRMRRFVFLWLALLSIFSCNRDKRDHVQAPTKHLEARSNDMGKTELPTGVPIEPGVSIGKVSLGQAVGSLPGPEKQENGTVTVPPGISASIKDGRVVDIWLEDIRALAMPVIVAGVTIPPDAPLERIKELLGPCQEVPVKGGMFFNCKAGVAIGTDFLGEGRFVQVRVGPR